MRKTLRDAACLLAACCFCAGAVAQDRGPGQGELEEIVELESLLKMGKRQTDRYQIAVEPIDLDRILLTDRNGDTEVFHYLILRLRNMAGERTGTEFQAASAYEEVLQQVLDEYRATGVRRDGAALVLEGDDGRTDVVVDRDSSNPPVQDVSHELISAQGDRGATVSIDLNVVAYDENGTRMQMLDDARFAWNNEARKEQDILDSTERQAPRFADTGERRVNVSLDEVRKEVEELVNRRLYTVDEITELELPEYDPSQSRNEYGESVGEAYVVVVFERLPVEGDTFTVEIHGLSNYPRSDLLLFGAQEPGVIDDYVNSAIYGRVYELVYSRPGDEYYLHRDDFDLTSRGWAWRKQLQRLETRRLIAEAEYFLASIEREANPNRPASEAPEYTADDRVIDMFMQDYRAVRERAEERVRTDDEPTPHLDEALQKAPVPDALIPRDVDGQ